MNADKELLELAAKAAGITLKPVKISNVTKQGDDRFIGLMTDAEQWPKGWFNPLTDDGDALRLAVKLKLDIFFHPSRVEAHIAGGRIPTVRHIAKEGYANDPYAAARRAIVRAAAEIGKAIQ